MRKSISALFALGISMPVAFAGGGTVTSTEPGPQALTTETTEQMLDTMGTEQESAEPASPETAVIYAPPPPAPAMKQEDAKTTEPEETEIAEAEPLTPREMVQQCATCHGYDGIAKIPTAPNIAGSSRQYLETQLKAFRSGKRENEVMSVISEDLSNADIKVVAKWYASLKVTVETPE